MKLFVTVLAAVMAFASMAAADNSLQDQDSTCLRVCASHNQKCPEEWVSPTTNDGQKKGANGFQTPKKKGNVRTWHSIPNSWVTDIYVVLDMLKFRRISGYRGFVGYIGHNSTLDCVLQSHYRIKSYQSQDLKA